MTDIAQLLGKDADNLLQHRCMTIPSDQLYLPGHDYVDRVMIDNNRPPAVLRNMQTLYNTGRLAGTGYLSILPVDQGVEHSAGASFAANPLTSPDDIKNFRNSFNKAKAQRKYKKMQEDKVKLRPYQQEAVDATLNLKWHKKQ